MSGFNSKMHQIRFRLGTTLGAYSVPQTAYLDLRGHTFLGIEGNGGERKRREGK